MGGHGNPQPRPFADSHGNFLRAEETGNKGGIGIRDPGGYKELQQIHAFFHVLPAGVPDLLSTAVGASDITCPMASLHADTGCQKPGPLDLFLLDHLFHSHVNVILIAHASGGGDTA